MNSQQLILDRIAATIDATEGITLISDREYANTGTLRTIDTASLHQIAAVSYDFQNGYCHFGPVTDRVAAHWYGQSAEGKASWVKGSIPDLVAAVVTHLTTIEGNTP